METEASYKIDRNEKKKRGGALIKLYYLGRFVPPWFAQTSNFFEFRGSRLSKTYPIYKRKRKKDKK